MFRLFIRKIKPCYRIGKEMILWHLSYYILRKRFPVACGMYITNRCNFKCRMCDVWKNGRKSDLPADIFRKIIDGLSAYHCCYVSFSGGEPLLLEDIVDRVAYAKEKIPYVHIVTNGFLLDEEMARKLGGVHIDEVSISIDGLQKRHDFMRGYEGAFERAVGAVENLKKFAPHVTIIVNSIISPDDIDSMYEISALVEKLGVFHKFQALGKYRNFRASYRLSGEGNIYNPEQLRRLKEFISFIRRRKNVVNSRYYLSKMFDFFSGNNKDGIFSDRCNYGYYNCQVMENGELSPCLSGTGYVNGFLLGTGTLGDLLSSERYRAKQHELRSCLRCQDDMPVCYLEPRIIFPLSNFIRYTVLHLG